MQQEAIQENKMGTMPVNKLLITMSIPMIISMLVQAFYNVVDSVFVAQINENALTAVSMAFPIQNLMIAVATGTGVGVNALLSKSLGENNRKLANKAANNSIFLAVMSYAVFLIFGITCSELFFKLQTDIPEIISYGKDYLSIVCILSFGMFLQIACDRLLQATGQTIYTMFTQGIGAIINIILDPIMIFGLCGFPRMEVAGAALATVLGQIVAAIISAVFNIAKNTDIHLEIKEIVHPNKTVIGHIYSVGIPSIIMSSISSVMTFSMNKILMAFTPTATAVFGVYFKLQSFVFMPVFGMNNGLVPIIAYNYGAKKKDRITKAMKLGIFYAFCMLMIGFALFQLIPDTLLLLFNASEEMLAIGVPALKTISFSYFLAPISIIGISVLQSLGRGIYSMFVSVGRQLVVLVPVAFLIAKLTGNLTMIWWAFPLAELMSVTLCFFFVRKTMNALDF